MIATVTQKVTLIDGLIPRNPVCKHQGFHLEPLILLFDREKIWVWHQVPACLSNTERNNC